MIQSIDFSSTDSTPSAPIHIGTVGWSLRVDVQELFPAGKNHLERYAGRFGVTEINSTFKQQHRVDTWKRWKETVPDDFRFALKMPKSITHEAGLLLREDVVATLDSFLEETSHLGEKRGPILVQLPPSFAFDQEVVETFFTELRDRHDGPVVCEPRHPTWFNENVESLLIAHNIARVAADPAVVPDAMRPAGSNALYYLRLHGSPRVYYSPYSDPFLERLAAGLQRLASSGSPVWCIFDNTAEGEATRNGLRLKEMLEGG